MEEPVSLIDFFDRRADEFEHIVKFIDKDALFPFALTSHMAHSTIVSVRSVYKTTYKSAVISIPMVKWAISNGASIENVGIAAVNHATEIDVLDYILSIGNYLPSICAASAHSGNLKVMQWARANGCPWGGNTCAAAALNGHLSVLQWARANGCPWYDDTCSCAAFGGHLSVLQWARANGCPWDGRTCMLAAHGGHLSVLQWAHANGCPWNEDTCAAAALNGHLDVLQWARANDCPWGNTTLEYAVMSGNNSVLEWMHNNGFP